jgi:hypothetical protein
MPDIPELAAAIDTRLADIAAEVSALDAAKAELVAPRTGSQAHTIRADVAALRSRPRAARRRMTSGSQKPEPATRRSASKRVEVAREPGAAMTLQRSTRRRPTTLLPARSGVRAVGAETLERFLADTSTGLSANAIAKQIGSPYSRTLKLLHDLQGAGQVRRSGSRRSTVWKLITDEERIATRAAELERLASAPGQRRGRAGAS